nr:hypothetical protein 42 [bacterium]
MSYLQNARGNRAERNTVERASIVAKRQLVQAIRQMLNAATTVKNLSDQHTKAALIAQMNTDVAGDGDKLEAIHAALLTALGTIETAEGTSLGIPNAL